MNFLPCVNDKTVSCHPKTQNLIQNHKQILKPIKWRKSAEFFHFATEMGARFDNNHEKCIKICRQQQNDI